MLPHQLLESAAYASLDLASRALLTELVMLYRGDNNGSIYLSAQDAAARLGQVDKRPALRAFDVLQDRGFIALAKEAHFRVKAADSSRARCWRLTWHAWPECPTRSKRAPTNDWQQYQPPGQSPATDRTDRRLRALAKYRKKQGIGYFPGVKFTPMEANMATTTDKPGGNFTPANLEKTANPPSVVGVNITPYIDDTRGRGVLGWWGNDQMANLAAQYLYFYSVANFAPQRMAA